MIDLKLLRDIPETVGHALEARSSDVNIDVLLKLDAERPQLVFRKDDRERTLSRPQKK